MEFNLIKDLKWRGLIQDITPGTEELLLKKNIKAYIGFDPTGDSLHIGSLVPIILLKHLQNAGHTPIALVGGATGMVGDPSGKSEERNMLDIETLKYNTESIKKQIAQFISFDANLPNAAIMVNNFDWFENMSFLDFIRDIGKHITVNYMMAKDSVQNRLQNGMSFTEFSYQLVQGYDFYYLHKNMNVQLQMGGSDQWGNIVTGMELIRRKSQEEAFAFTAPLIKKSDGGKFGKTESGNIWLSAEKTSPYKFYQFWLNTTDEDAENYIKIFTFLSQEEINKIIENHKQEPHLRLLQQKLAEEISIWVHSKEQYEFAKQASEILFGKDTATGLAALNENELLEIMEGVPGSEASFQELETATSLVDFCTKYQIFSSKGEAKKMIHAGALSLNKNKVEQLDTTMEKNMLLLNKYILIQKGKKNYYFIRFS